MIGRLAWSAAEAVGGFLLAVAEWRESRRPCVRCGDRPTDAASQMCVPCLWGPPPERPS